MTEFRPGRFEILPLVIKNLLIVNVLFFLAQNTLGRAIFNMEDLFALHHVKSPLFKPWQLITHMFLHGAFDAFVGQYVCTRGCLAPYSKTFGDLNVF